MTVLFLVFIALAAGSLTADLPEGGDDVSYVSLAESLVAGRGYVSAIYPGNPPVLEYPPVFPLLLSPLVAAFGARLLILKMIPALAGGTALFSVFALLRSRLGADRAFLIAMLTGLNGYFLSIATKVMSETVYLTLSAIAIILVHRVAAKGGVRRTLVAGLLIALVVYTRTIGGALALASCITLLFRRRVREAFVLGGLLFCAILPWALRSIALQNSYLYYLFSQPMTTSGAQGDQMLWLARLYHNAPRYAGKAMGDLFFHPFTADMDPHNILKILMSITVTLAITAGYLAGVKDVIVGRRADSGIWAVRRWEGLTNLDCGLLYLLVYVGICLVWPYHDARFLVPLLPFLLEPLS